MSSPKSDKNIVICYCPQCGNIHEREMYWTGRKTLFGKPVLPKKRCTKCNTKQFVELTTNQNEGLTILFDVFRML